jgi:hypothetical protein
MPSMTAFGRVRKALRALWREKIVGGDGKTEYRPTHKGLNAAIAVAQTLV